MDLRKSLWNILRLTTARRACPAILLALGCIGLSPEMFAQAAEVVTLGVFREPNGRISCSSMTTSNALVVLEASHDLVAWREIARTHGGLRRFPLTLDTSRRQTFFRTRVAPRADEDDWKNQLNPPNDPFLSKQESEGGPGTRWAKFTIRLEEPDRIYFQDNARYPFHYSFAVKRLPGLEELSPQAFDDISIQPSGQRLVLGAVILPTDPTVREIGIQIVGRQPFPVAQVVDWLDRVRAVLALPPQWTVLYLPTHEQGTLSEADVSHLANRGFQVGTPARWVKRDECYSPGWAHGRLKYVPAAEISRAYANGDLKHSDILLTDTVPAEIPLLAATISLTPATPNSHVAILSQSFGVPFVYIATPTDQQQLRNLDGQEILLLADKSSGATTIQTLPVQNLLTPAQRDLLLKAKQPPALHIAPYVLKGSFALPVRDLLPQDVRFVGGKAANFGVLMRSIPDSAPTNAIALTFDLWQAFLGQILPDGKSLRQMVTDRLKTHVFPPDPARLTRDLAEIRALIRERADFTPDQRSAVLAALRSFDPRRKLRFRSSTNVEDSEQFSGAGLYDSYSGCVADDTDADNSGPSHCQESETEERGVFRALRRVYASFYNDNAFIERLRHRIDEESVGMAVLVHTSFPDETELANGVATLRLNRKITPDATTYTGELVTQRGAESVSNPAGNALPEVITVTKSGTNPPVFAWNRHSSLVPLGDAVLKRPDEYVQLFGLLKSASDAYLASRAGENPPETGLVLDVEYKKVEPGRLVLKQIREVPASIAATNRPPFVLNDAGRLVVFQHHGKDLYANHRLKSIWQFQSLTFNDQSKPGGFDTFVRVDRHDGMALRSYSGRMSSFPGASIRVSGKTLEFSWSWSDGPLAGKHRMTAEFDQVLNTNRPVPISQALLVELTTTYDRPQTAFDFNGSPRTISTEKTRLVPIDKIIEGNRLERKRTARKGRVTVETDYTLAFLKFGAPGIGIFDTKSFPLVRWKGTTLSGFSSNPIRLNSEFSQTYDSIRHNFQETFVFEPGLEPGLDAGTLAELRAANIKAIWVSKSELNFPGNGDEPDIRIWGFDNSLRSID